jgi:hypothetical protein
VASVQFGSDWHRGRYLTRQHDRASGSGSDSDPGLPGGRAGGRAAVLSAGHRDHRPDSDYSELRIFKCQLHFRRPA